MKELIKNKWKRILEETSGSQEYYYLTPLLYIFSYNIKTVIEKYQKGYTLDIGAGNSPYRFLCKGNMYFSMDISPKKNVNIVADANLLPFKDQTFDTILCLLMLEHTKKPHKIVKEISRILKPSGTLIIAVPHIMYLHDEPNDYYRFTKYGLKYMCEEYGMLVKEMIPIGDIFSLFSTFISKTLLTITYKIPIIYHIVFYLNRIFIYSVMYFEQNNKSNHIFASDYIAVAVKLEQIR